jgi:hypothetical protein
MELGIRLRFAKALDLSLLMSYQEYQSKSEALSVNVS